MKHYGRIFFFLFILLQTGSFIFSSPQTLLSATQSPQPQPASHIKQPASGSQETGDNFFSPEELAYLQSKKQITMCIDPDWMPLEKIENGKHVGMTADYFDLFQQKVSVPITLVPTKTWPESVEYGKARKCDIFSLAMPTPERETFMDFTQPYLSIPLVLAAKADMPFVDDITTLTHITLGVVQGYAFGELLRTRYPQMKIVDVASVDLGLQHVAEGELDGFIGTLATVGYSIQKGFADELKVAGKFDERWELGVATRKDEPLLHAVFGKIIASIDRSEHQRILNRWISVKFIQQTNYTLLRRILSVVTLGVIFLLWRNYTLGKYSRKLKDQNEQISKQTKKLQQAEKQLLFTQHAVDTCAFPILWVSQGKTLADSRIIHANQAATDLLGYREGQILALSLDMVDAELADDEWQRGQQKQQEESSLSYKTTFRRMDGSFFPVELFASSFPYQGQNYQFLFFMDVTEQQKMEKEMLKARKLESVGVLAGGIAHDFNNILAAIVGSLNLAQLDADLSDDTRELLSAAEKASIRAKGLTQQLLTFSKGGEPIKQAASIHEVIKDSADFVLHGKNTACKYNIPDDLWLVEIDKGQISQVIQNIIINANHAMPNGGIIQVRCENIDPLHDENVSLPHDKKFVKIIIADSGTGIPVNLIDKIFDPYFSTKQEGSGLGLAISHSIIKKHNGQISVESNPGTGTTFTIYLPASIQKLIQKTAESPLGLSTGKAKIMVMDDEKIVRDVAETMLNRLGHEVLLAEDGKQALELYKSHKTSAKPIDIVIMDLTIPGGMGGKDALQEILAFDPDAKVIVSSGYSNDPIMANCRKYGFCCALVKPYQFDDLTNVIHQAFDASTPRADRKR